MTDWDFRQLLIGAAAGRQAQKRQGHADRQQAYQEGYRDGNHAKLGGASGGSRALDLCSQAGFAAASYAVAVGLERIVQELSSSARAEFAKAYLAVPDRMAKTSVEKALRFPRKRFEVGDYTLMVHDGDKAGRLASDTWNRLDQILAEAAKTPLTGNSSGSAGVVKEGAENALAEVHADLERLKRAAADRERSLHADALVQRQAAEAEKKALRRRFLRAGRKIGAGDAAIQLLENLPCSALLSIAESCLNDPDAGTDLIGALVPSVRETQITLDRGEIREDALEQEAAAQESRVRNILFNAVKDELAEAGSREESLVGLLSLVRPPEHEPAPAADE